MFDLFVVVAYMNLNRLTGESLLKSLWDAYEELLNVSRDDPVDIFVIPLCMVLNQLNKLKKNLRKKACWVTI